MLGMPNLLFSTAVLIPPRIRGGLRTHSKFRIFLYQDCHGTQFLTIRNPSTASRKFWFFSEQLHSWPRPWSCGRALSRASGPSRPWFKRVLPTPDVQIANSRSFWSSAQSILPIIISSLYLYLFPESIVGTAVLLIGTIRFNKSENTAVKFEIRPYKFSTDVAETWT